MTVRTVTLGELTPEQRRVHRVEHILRRDGGSPGSALEGLAAIVEDETWRKVPRGADDLRPFGSFLEFVTARANGLNTTREQLLALLRLRHPGEGNADVHARMEAMRSEVGRLLKAEIEPAAGHGEIGNGRSRVDAAKSTAIANSVEYVIARLKRDHPDLAQQVIDGELTPNAAAHQAGIRKPRILLTNPRSIADALRKHLAPGDLEELVRLLGEPHA